MVPNFNIGVDYINFFIFRKTVILKTKFDTFYVNKRFYLRGGLKKKKLFL